MLTELQRTELLFVLEPQIRPYCGSLLFARSPNSWIGNVNANGSFGLVDTGKKKLLVTCHHVWEEFQKLRREDSEMRWLVCFDQNPPVIFDPDQPIDQDEKLDLATFAIDSLLADSQGHQFYRINQNPARRVTKGDPLFLVGYPGSLRSATDKDLRLGKGSYTITVADVSGLSFVADISRAERSYFRDSEPTEHANPHGGISGSPCFLVTMDRIARLVGFTNSVALGLLRFTHARCLNPDGSINRQAI